MSTTGFTTSKGVKGRTGTSRRYIVIRHYEGKPVILYRTNDASLALARAAKYDGIPEKEVVDLVAKVASGPAGYRAPVAPKATCTVIVSAATGECCGEPAVETFTTRRGTAYAECARHFAGVVG